MTGTGNQGGRRPWWAGVRIVAALALAPAVVGTVGAQQAPPGPDADSPRIERKLGEDEQIRMRREWFFSTRRAGTESPEQMADLRARGVQATRLALQRQRARQAASGQRTDNIWVPMGPSPSTFGGWSFGNVSGRITALAADWTGGVLWVGTAAGGVWRSTNDGLNWTQMFDSAGTMTVGAVAVDPSDPDVVWVGTGDNVTGCEGYFGIGMLRSVNGGVTWEPRNGSGTDTLDDMASFASVIVDPRDPNHLVAGGRIRQCQDGSGFAGGLYTTDDAGLTWSARLSNVSIYEIAQDPTLLDVFWAATSVGVYTSVDNGVTWSLQTASGLPSGGVGRMELAIAPTDGDTVYALFSSPTSFWRTTDGGASWSQMSSGGNACDGQCFYNMVLRVDRADSGTVYRGTVHVFRSINGGSSWTDLSNNWGSNQKVHQDTHVFLMNPDNPDVFYVGSDGGVWKTADGGNSFTNRNGNLNVTQFYAIDTRADDPTTICGGAQDNSSLVRTAGEVWDLQAVTGDGFVCAFDPVDPNYAYITSYPSGGYPNVWRSTSGPFGGFGDITGSGSGIVGGDRINWVTPYIVDPMTPTTLYLGTHRVYRSDNHGSSWTQVGPSDLTGGSGSLLTVEVNRNFHDIVYSGSDSGRVWRATDGGAAWNDITSGLPPRSINDIAGDPSDPDHAFAVVGGFNEDHVWEWTAGSGWVARSAGLPNVPANTVLMLGSQDILVGVDTGVFRSADGGTTWQPFMAGLPEGLVVTDLKYNGAQNTITAGTYGRGAWQVSIGPVAPIVLFDTIEFPAQEIDGDGDDHIEPGETWSVRARLRNGGGETAFGVSARLRPDVAGVAVLAPATAEFGDLAPGQEVSSATPYIFTIDPSFDCGQTVVFDLVDIVSSNAPASYPEAPAALTVSVLDDTLPGPIDAVVDDDFDPQPGADWSHEAISPGVAPCATFPYYDQWQVLSKDAEHGVSFHCGGGPSGTYGSRDFSWLYYGGKDSDGGAGVTIPDDAISASLVIEHWYDTVAGSDGAQVVIDAVADGQDVYEPLEPLGGYPGGALTSGNCNGLQGMETFTGSSSGWITSTFDLLAYRGTTVHLAFVFASDYRPTYGEGWYVDSVTVEVQRPGTPVCQIVPWPGSVPQTAQFELAGDGTITADWGDACNVDTVPTQSYSIQAGDLDALHADGVYTHAAVDGSCALASPSTFSPGAGNQYYVVVPVDAEHQGGAGAASDGTPRPTPDATCGLAREASCP